MTARRREPVPSAVPGSVGDGSWRGYWEEIEDSQVVFSVEARDYAARVRRLLGVRRDMIVLDFGCGFGHTARALAPDVAQIALWDASANVRRQARERIADLRNAQLIDLDGPEQAEARERFDLILVHSVLQYMSTDEIQSWLLRWRAMLKRDGRLVVSDLIVPGSGGLGELMWYLVFAMRRGFFWNALTAGARETANYFKARQSRPLTTASRATLAEWASKAGFALEWLDENLSHRRARATAVLRTAG